jgi:hypothetical protein
MTKPAAEFEAIQRELGELRKRFADAERESRKEIRDLEKRVEALERVALPYLQRKAE